MEVLVEEVEATKHILFGGHSVGITNAKKPLEWQLVADAVNAAGSEGRTLSEIKKTWSYIKVEAKRRIALHRHKCLCHRRGKGDTGAQPPR